MLHIVQYMQLHKLNILAWYLFSFAICCTLTTIQAENLVVFPQEIQSICARLQQAEPSSKNSNAIIEKSLADDLLVQAFLALENAPVLSSEEYEEAKAYLHEYQLYLATPEAWISPEDFTADTRGI